MMKISAMFLAAATTAVSCAYAQTTGGTGGTGGSGPSTAGIGSPSAAGIPAASAGGIPSPSAGGIGSPSSAGISSPSSAGIPSPSGTGTGTVSARGTSGGSLPGPINEGGTDGTVIPPGAGGGTITFPAAVTTIISNGTITGGVPIESVVPPGANGAGGRTVLQSGDGGDPVRPQTAPTADADGQSVIEAPARPVVLELQPSAVLVSTPSGEMPVGDAQAALDRDAGGAELTTTTAVAPEGVLRPAASYSTEETASRRQASPEGRQVRYQRTIEK